jgi:hypothetical protein
MKVLWCFSVTYPFLTYYVTAANRKMVAADVGRGEYFRDVFPDYATDWLSLVVRICEKCRIESVHLGD